MMKKSMIAVSIAALISSLSAENSPLDSVISKKETRKRERPDDKEGTSAPEKTKRRTESDGPSKEEQKILATIAKYPETVAQILQEGVQNKQAEQRLTWARNIQENLTDITEDSIHFGDTEDADVSVLMIVDFLCPHCQTHLKMMRDIRRTDKKINFIVYSVPLFSGDLTREYGLILNAAYKKDAKKFLNLLGSYADGKPSQEALLKKLEDFKISIKKTDYSDLRAYDKKASIMDKIGLTQVPASFALLKDEDGGTIVVPLNITSSDSLIKTVEQIENVSSEDFEKIKKDLGQ